MLETERLIIREYLDSDFDDLHEIFSDPESMKYYPAPFSEEMTRAWIQRNKDRYRIFGFGLWALVLKENGEVIGDCGITMQMIDGVIRPELGYHLKKEYRKKGLATEAGKTCIEYIFANTPFCELYSYMKTENIPSAKVAERVGMKFMGEYDDKVNTVSRYYMISRSDPETD